MKDKLLMFVQGLGKISQSDPSSASILKIVNNIVLIFPKFFIGALLYTPYLTPSSPSVEKDRLHQLLPVSQELKYVLGSRCGVVKTTVDL